MAELPPVERHCAVKQGDTVSSPELLALARSLAQEYRRRCTALAEELRALGFAEEADAFAQAAVPGQRAMRSAGRKPDLGRIAPERQAVLLAEAGWRDAEDPVPLTPYSALAWAVERSEQRFRLYGTLAAHAETPEARERAEDLAQAELIEAACLRLARRKAYRAERAAGRLDRMALARKVSGVDDLRGVALEIEIALSAQLAAADLPEAEGALAVTREVLEALGQAPGEVPPARRADRAAIARALDEAFALYDLIQSRAAEEAVMERAQWLARRTLDRLRRLRPEH